MNNKQVASVPYRGAPINRDGRDLIRGWKGGGRVSVFTRACRIAPQKPKEVKLSDVGWFV